MKERTTNAPAVARAAPSRCTTWGCSSWAAPVLLARQAGRAGSKMPDASTLRSVLASSPQRPKSALLRSPERKARIENGGEGGRRGNTEEQYGHVNWAGTLRQKVWDDKSLRASCFAQICPEYSKEQIKK